MRTINKLKLLEHGIGQSDFIKKKAQTAILGGNDDPIICRCGFYGNYTSDCLLCPHDYLNECLDWAVYYDCGAGGATCSKDTGVKGLQCN